MSLSHEGIRRYAFLFLFFFAAETFFLAFFAVAFLFAATFPPFAFVVDRTEAGSVRPRQRPNPGPFTVYAERASLSPLGSDRT